MHTHTCLSWISTVYKILSRLALVSRIITLKSSFFYPLEWMLLKIPQQGEEYLMLCLSAVLPQIEKHGEKYQNNWKYFIFSAQILHLSLWDW